MTALYIKRNAPGRFCLRQHPNNRFPPRCKNIPKLVPFSVEPLPQKKRHEQNKSNDLLCIWCILQKRGISFCLHLWFYHPLLWMSTTKIAHTRFFAQICHQFWICAPCIIFLISLSTPYKFREAVPHFLRTFKRQQISKFAKFMKPLPHLLQSFDRISRIFPKKFGNFAGIFFARSFRYSGSDFAALCRL